MRWLTAVPKILRCNKLSIDMATYNQGWHEITIHVGFYESIVTYICPTHKCIVDKIMKFSLI